MTRINAFPATPAYAPVRRPRLTRRCRPRTEEPSTISIPTNVSVGACVKDCSHGARTYEDDTAGFWNDVKGGKQVVLLVAPSIKVAFDGCWRNVLEFLRSNGVKDIYDVSFGADICTWAHIRYLQKNPGKKLISQPCPAIVNYMLKYCKEALPNLSPVQSPILCAAIYLRKYLGVNAKLAAPDPLYRKAGRIPHDRRR